MPARHNQGGTVPSDPSLNAEPGCIKVVDTLRIALTPAQLSMLLEGIDWRIPRRVKRPELAG